MPRTHSKPKSLAVVQTQISRIQAALAKLQVEIERLRRGESLRSRSAAGGPTTTLVAARQAAEHDVILQIGDEHRWNRSRMARALGVDRKSLYRKLAKYKLLAAHPAPAGPPPNVATKAKQLPNARRRRS